MNKDKHGDKTIEELRAELAAKTGENVVIRRFARFAGGGGVGAVGGRRADGGALFRRIL